MRLTQIQRFLGARKLPFEYWEEDACGSIEFEYRGLRYFVWEYPPPERGASSNVRTAGRSEEFDGDYEAEIIRILETWEGIS